MYKNKKIIAIIPARGGSKGITNKNIRLIKGKPLIYYAIKAAKDTKVIDKIIVSTNSNKIANIAKKFNASVPFLRPDYLANDKAKTIDCIMYTINKLKESGENYDVLVILQPTSPLRTKDDILGSLKLHFEKKDDVVSINEVDINPLLIRTIKNNNLSNLLNFSSTMRRQDLPKYYKVNGAIYINSINKLSSNTSLNDNKIGYIMNVDNSIDIDTKKDLIKARKKIK